MANTTNYNWETPDDTDLVKDGAAAIRTLGSSIDTTTKALNPETTLGDIAYRSATANTNTRLAVGSNGQVLTVAGGVPSWATPTTGDIEGVTAGTGISGGGTSGTVTITNSMATAIDAKGDLVVGTGADAFSRLAVGTNGYTLVADSSTATGLAWQAASSGSSFSGCSLGRSAVLSLANETNVAVSFDQEVFDIGGYHDNSTNNSRITIPSGKAGKYAVCGTAVFAANTSGIRSVYLYKNGSSTGNLWQMSPNTSSGDFISLSFSKIVDLAEADYLELYVSQSSGGSLNLRFESTSNLTNFAAYLIGA